METELCRAKIIDILLKSEGEIIVVKWKKRDGSIRELTGRLVGKPTATGYYLAMDEKLPTEDNLRLINLRSIEYLEVRQSIYKVKGLS